MYTPERHFRKLELFTTQITLFFFFFKKSRISFPILLERKKKHQKYHNIFGNVFNQL